jgi:hypothetical protein
MSVRPEVSKPVLRYRRGRTASFVLRYLSTNGYSLAETMIKAPDFNDETLKIKGKPPAQIAIEAREDGI